VQASFDPGFDVVEPVPAALPASLRAEPWYAGCRVSAGTSVTAAIAADKSVMFCAAMRDDAARPMGAFILRLSPEAVLARLMEEWSVPATADVVLLDDSHRVLATGRASATGSATRAVSVIGRADVLRALGTDGGGVIEADTDGGAVVVAYDRIHPFNWTLVSVLPAATVFAR
jgi:hypothetical protein